MVCVQNILGVDIFDVGKFIFSGNIFYFNEFDGVIFFIGNVYQDGGEVVDFFVVMQLLFNFFFYFICYVGIVCVENVVSVGVIVVVMVMENDCFIVE